MTPHVKGCRCEACLEGLTVQHPVGCSCTGCAERQTALAGGMLSSLWLHRIGRRVQKAIRAAEAVKDVLTPAERDAVVKFIRRRA